ncbi:MAG: ABC-F family ATP-binding cassette domain-containing protein [Gammaproteobacteria bacterium]|nr:ABC-F family ATP-binding cassette domain-containing protein [Gammaproteobacteria bacterium]
MSLLLQARINSHSEGGRLLFADLSLSIGRGDRLALVGHNGCGKSTLLALLAGHRAPDDGEVRPQKGLRLAQVEQFIPSRLTRSTVLEAVLDASLGARESWRAEALLFQLGFGANDLTTALQNLSGGRQTLVLVARTMLRDPDLMLLDEPSNHLDLDALVALERRLLAFQGAFVIVSHDRRFLDRVTRETLFMRDQAILRIRRPYSEAKRRLDAADEAARAARDAEEKRIDSLRRSAQRLAQWGRDFDNEDLSKRAKAMKRRIERLEDERTFVTSGSPLELSLELGTSRSKLALKIEETWVPHPADPTKHLFRVPETALRNGDRVALLGENGVGKSTFIRMIVEAAAAPERTTELRLSPQTKLGYFDQELAEVVGEQRMIDFVLKRVPHDSHTVTARLGRAGFDETDRNKPLSVLSGGERARLMFTVISMSAPNFLILDEPTNHLDIEGREHIEAELERSKATLLITSHDRLFAQTLANRFLWIREGRLIEVPSPEAYFEASRVTELPPRAPKDVSPSSEDETLERIVELEGKIEAMLRRKAKHQKPERVAHWRAEVSRLNAKLG